MPTYATGVTEPKLASVDKELGSVGPSREESGRAVVPSVAEPQRITGPELMTERGSGSQ